MGLVFITYKVVRLAAWIPCVALHQQGGFQERDEPPRVCSLRTKCPAEVCWLEPHLGMWAAGMLACARAPAW
eukprot:6206130-Pleurochrysis_carterae.AAC.3